MDYEKIVHQINNVKAAEPALRKWVQQFNESVKKTHQAAVALAAIFNKLSTDYVALERWENEGGAIRG